MESHNQAGRSYYLESNAWINLGNNALLYKSLKARYSRGQISIVTATQLVDELVTKPELTQIQSDTNRLLLEPFLGQMIDDKLFVLDESLLDGAVLGSDSSNALYAAHLNQRQGKNDSRDGIHLVNTSVSGAALVTCDNKLKRSAQRLGVEFLCLADFEAECSLDGAYNCPGCK